MRPFQGNLFGTTGTPDTRGLARTKDLEALRTTVTGIETSIISPVALAAYAANRKFYNAAMAVGTGTAVTGSFVFMPGPPSVSFTKVAASTNVRVAMHFTCYKTTNIGAVTLGIYDGSTSHTVGQMYFNNLAVHHAFSGVKTITGLSAGTRTFTAVWKQAAVEMNVDTNDWISFEVLEVPA